MIKFLFTLGLICIAIWAAFHQYWILFGIMALLTFGATRMKD